MRKTTLFCLLMCVLVLPYNIAGAEELTAEQVVKKSWEQYRAKYEKELVKITISYQDGRKEEKKLVRWTSFDPNQEDSVTIKFQEPALDRGLGLLTQRHSQAKDEQWLKLPSMKSARKISAGEQDKYFAGTDFTNEDIRQLIGERTKDFDYRLINKDNAGWTIEATPKPGVETGYSKRILKINPQMVMTTLEYYGKNGELLKTQTNSRIVILGNNIWRPNLIEVNNLLLKRRTVVDIGSRDLNTEIPQNVFTKDFLESERM